MTLSKAGPAGSPSIWGSVGRDTGASPTPVLGAGVFGADPARARFYRVICLVLAAVGWGNLAILGRTMLSQRPPTAGLDLELLLSAGRRVAAGGSPYDPNVVAHGLQARDLFFSYPPIVAQVLSPFSGLPTWLVLTGWCIGAAAGIVLMAALLPRAPIGRPAAALSALSRDTALLAFATAPYFFPFTIAVLFGNVDAWFPLLFGAVALTLASHGAAPSRASLIAAGAALAVASAIKLHPVTVVVWLIFRWPGPGVRQPRRTTIAAVTAAGIGILAVSLLAGGPGLWREYIDYLHLGAAADLATQVNIGPASQFALLVGDLSLARPLAVVFAILAVSATVAAARLVHDPLESMSWAIVASLVVLPVTWYHYPVALIPVALAAWTRSRGTARARNVTAVLAASLIVADLAVVLPVALWLAVALLFVAVRRSRGDSTPLRIPPTESAVVEAVGPTSGLCE